MRLIVAFVSMVSCFIITGCVHKGTNPLDPYESFNRKVHDFNLAFDATMIRPPTRLYVMVVPALVRKGIDNAYNNLDMLPTVANDVLQGKGIWAIRDTWRFVINSTLGVAGFIDVANTFGLPPHYNDLGLTFAKWGDKQSPYIVLPFLGPSTIRDGYGLLFQFTLWSPYVYLHNEGLAFGLLGLRYIDLRSQFFDTEKLMNEALDPYAFLRDAYLQHRNYLIIGASQEDGALYAQDVPLENAAEGGDYVDE